MIIIITKDNVAFRVEYIAVRSQRGKTVGLKLQRIIVNFIRRANFGTNKFYRFKGSIDKHTAIVEMLITRITRYESIPAVKRSPGFYPEQFFA